MKALTLFYPLVLPHVVGCPNPLLDQALLSAASDFCRQTQIIQEVSTQNIVSGFSDYDLDVPVSQQLVAVMRVWHADTELAPAGTDEVHVGTAVRGAVSTYTPAAGTPTAFFQKIPTDATITLYPVPNASVTDGLAVRACFEPTATATTLADPLYDLYADAIGNGAAAYLLSLPGQVFSNPVLGEAFRRRFTSDIDDVKPVARSGRVRRSLRVQPRTFA